MTSGAGRAALAALAIAATVALGAYLVWGLRSLIVPVVVGGLLAYICRPILVSLERARIPRAAGVVLLLVVFAIAAVGIANSVRAVVPNEIKAIEMRIHALHRLNEQYRALMGLDPSLTRGNRLYGWVHRDLDPVIDRVNEVLALAPEERATFLAAHRSHDRAADRLLAEDRANVETLALRVRHAAMDARSRTGDVPRTDADERIVSSPPASAGPPIDVPSVGMLGTILSTWIIAPLVFVFLLLDTGEIKRGLLGAVPNRLFEPALAVLADLDRALGAYVRGIFLECCVLGATVALFMAIIGVPFGWAITIGIVTGASNVIPYMGFAAALLSGLAYAIVVGDVHPILPIVTRETFLLWVVGAVCLAELLKNAIYEPVVLGGAVHLHPLVVVIGVISGATLFGPVGMLLAIPTITVVTVFVRSTARHLRAYGVI